MGQKDVWNAREPQVTRTSSRSSNGPSSPGCYPSSTRASSRTWRRCPHRGGPGRHPADRHPVRPDPRLPELHRDQACGPAPAQHGDHTRIEPQRFRPAGRRPGRLPNGRRVFDDVVAIELRAIAGATYPLVDGSFTPDAAASAVDDGVGPDDVGMPYLEPVPLPGSAPQRFRRSRRSVMTADLSSSTSAATPAP